MRRIIAPPGEATQCYECGHQFKRVMELGGRAVCDACLLRAVRILVSFYDSDGKHQAGLSEIQCSQNVGQP